MKYFLVLIALMGFPLYGWSAESGDPAPECKLPLLGDDNQILSLNQLKGKVVFLDFWASWCPPCEKSFPFLDALQQEYHSQGLEVIAVNLDEGKQDAQTFVKHHPASFRIVYDAEGTCPEKYQVKAMPSSYIIDRAGKIRHVNYGFLTSEEDTLRSQVTSLLNE